METKGQMLRNAIRGKGMKIEDAARLLGMTRQNLSNYFQRDNLPEDLLLNVKSVLHIDLTEPLAIIHENQVETLTTLNKFNTYFGVPTDLKSWVISMGKLLQIPLDQLLKLQKSEQDNEKLKLIHEVIMIKQKLESLTKENELLRENNEYLKQKSLKK